MFVIGYYNYDLFKYSSDCNDWIEGLNNTSIENNQTKYGCLNSSSKNVCI